MRSQGIGIPPEAPPADPIERTAPEARRSPTVTLRNGFGGGSKAPEGGVAGNFWLLLVWDNKKGSGLLLEI